MDDQTSNLCTTASTVRARTRPDDHPVGFFDKIHNSGLACEPEESPAPLFAWFSITSEAWLNASRMATRGRLKWTKRSSRVRTGTVPARLFHPTMQSVAFRLPFAARLVESGSAMRTPRTNTGTRAYSYLVSTNLKPEAFSRWGQSPFKLVNWGPRPC
jgi:hypothetical protein